MLKRRQQLWPRAADRSMPLSDFDEGSVLADPLCDGEAALPANGHVGPPIEG